MKLLNYTSAVFSIILMIIIPIWAGLFYYAMLDEVYDSMDDGLDNQRQLIISKIGRDTSTLNRMAFEEGNYSIFPIAELDAVKHTDVFKDTLMYMQNEEDYEPVRMLQTVFKKGESYYQLSVITSMVEEDDLISELTSALLWLYFGLILTIVFLNNFLLRNIWKPFYQLIGQLKDVKLNKAQEFHYARTRIDEFKLLQNSVQRFVANNLTAFNNQKQFIENASHELQTPLAIAYNKLELLAESGDLQNDQAELLSSALNNLDRLKRLNQSLLLLSKIENEQFNSIAEEDITALTKKILEDFGDQFEYFNLTLKYTASSCIWTIDHEMANILLTNLIKNAIKHSSENGEITVQLHNNEFCIVNEGTEPLNSENIFKRFFKGGDAVDSTGLGLAIAKAVAIANGLEITYGYEKKHVFRVRPA